MGQILGLGITHYPNLAAQVNMSWRMQSVLADPKLPEHLRAVENWPPAMRAQWGRDRGQAHSLGREIRAAPGREAGLVLALGQEPAPEAARH